MLLVLLLGLRSVGVGELSITSAGLLVWRFTSGGLFVSCISVITV